MDSTENSANFELCFIYFYEQYAWFTADLRGWAKENTKKRKKEWRKFDRQLLQFFDLEIPILEAFIETFFFLQEKFASL